MLATFDASNRFASYCHRRVSFLIHERRYYVAMTTITINGTLSLGEVLALYRQMSGLDQLQMGERVGASRPTMVAAEERAQQSPLARRRELARLSKPELIDLLLTAEHEIRRQP